MTHNLLREVVFVVALPIIAGLAAADEFQPASQEEIVAKDAKLELLFDDGDFTEGPVPTDDGGVLFSDIGNRILRFDEKSGETKVFREPSGRANGLMFNPRGELVACEGANSGGGRRISITRNGKAQTLAAALDGKRFNSPNDLAIDSHGNVYFTDPRYVGDEPRDLDFEGVFLVRPDGKVKIATRDVQKPNGILVASNDKKVFVADNNPRGNRHLLAFDVAEDGTLTNRMLLFDFGVGRGIDGMTLDTQGRIYATAGRGEQAGVYVFSPEGKPLALIPTPGDPTNCVFGVGDSKHTLYITAQCPPPQTQGQPRRWGLYRIQLKTSGHHIWP